MEKTSQLLMPPVPLAGCVFAAIVRDTRGTALTDAERLNHFPASPLVALTIVFDGEARLVSPPWDLAEARSAAPLPAISIAGPHDRPLSSWSPGPLFAVSIGFYPEAWSALTGITPLDVAGRTISDTPEPLAGILRDCLDAPGITAFWDAFCASLEPYWRSTQGRGGAPSGNGLTDISNWARLLSIRVMLSGPGVSLRAAERRLRRWAGQSRQTLAFYASIDDLHRLSVAHGTEPLAGMAVEAGFSDQSHMGRAVRRATGFSPARLNRLIANDESFWCYRLLGERF